MSQASSPGINVVLVDKNGNFVGYKEKYETHKIPVALHSAISNVIFSNDRREMLITKRAFNKPTWPGFWSNTVCTHPLPDESYFSTATRRLQEEVGFVVPLKETLRFIYSADYDSVWGEHEYDVVFVGKYDGDVNPNPKEISDYKWVKIDELLEDVENNSDIYTPWFKEILKRLGY